MEKGLGDNFNEIAQDRRTSDAAPGEYCHLQNSPINGRVIGAPMPIKLLSLASPSRRLEKNQKGGCEERMLQGS